MRLLLSFTALAALAGALVLGAAKAPQPSETLPERAGKAPAVPFKVPDFRLLDHTGASHQLSRYADAQAVVLVYGGNGCPIVRQSVPALNALRDTYTPRGVLFAMVNANSQDGREDILREAEEFAINMPILLDTGQSLTRVFGVDRTATALVILPETREVVFRGAINDRFGYGTAKPEASHHWLRDAIEAVLAGRIPNPAETDARGCVITLETVPEPTEISYARDIAPIIQNRCVTCHSEGSIGPFAFNRHKTVQGWRGMMREVILTKRMPPWHADPVYGEFANDAALTPDEERTLLAWLDAGAPRGDGPDPLTRTPPPAEEWPLGEPDIVVPLPREIRIPAEGNVEYLYIPVDSGLTEDVWVRAATVVPGNRRVLHHCLVFVKYPNELVVEQPEYRGGLDGYFAGYVPGAEYAPYPEGTGKFIPKGARLVFQLHYTPTGRPETDNTKLGLYLHASKPVVELQTRAAYNDNFVIPPGALNHEVIATFRIRKDKLLWALSPHMHWRGSRFVYEAHLPDGRTETLLSVPNYDFNWQTQYRLREPRLLPAGTQIVCTAGFDNSARNPANPDPGQRVRFGEQTWDEMCIGYMDLSDPL